MRSRLDTRPGFAIAAAALILMLSIAGSASTTVPQPAERPSPADVARALDTVKADPNLAPTRTIKMLRWRDSTTPPRSSGWLTWIAGLFRWIDQSARVFAWGLAIVLAIALATFVVNQRRGRERAPAGEGFDAPSHVRDLDIRPESFPADIGAAARQLWDQGEHRAALALLYRGMLSRFAHVHRVPIRDSSTEHDCLALAATHVPDSTSHYACRLVGVWQRAVYGREDIEAAVVHGLCDGFSRALDTAARTGIAGSEAT